MFVEYHFENRNRKPGLIDKKLESLFSRTMFTVLEVIVVLLFVLLCFATYAWFENSRGKSLFTCFMDGTGTYCSSLFLVLRTLILSCVLRPSLVLLYWKTWKTHFSYYIVMVQKCNERHIGAFKHFNSFKRQPHRMLKHTQTICWQKPTNCLSVFDHFVRLDTKRFKTIVAWNKFMFGFAYSRNVPWDSW